MGRFALFLTGCGNRDGSEITEAVSCYLAISRVGGSVETFSLDQDQKQVLNYVSGEGIDQERNCMVEAARISRGEILPIEQFDAREFDCLVLPGGAGCFLNTTDIIDPDPLSRLLEGKLEPFTVDPRVEEMILSMHAAKKKIVAICAVPLLLMEVFHGKGAITTTFGPDPSFEEGAQVYGHVAKMAKCGDVVIDPDNRIYTTPAYMDPNGTPIAVFDGIVKAIEE
ncbi:MAG: Glyoxalase ElbB [Chlamydiia bacterium]|nr:Glyoxalase ElbB [Chlamydiia bacterium]